MAQILFKTCGAGSGGAAPVHFCNPCTEWEKGRVRSIALIDKSIIVRDADGDIAADTIGTLTWWNTNVLAGKILVIPETSGSFDGGAANAVAGYGDIKELTASKTFTLTANDPNHKENADFWNQVEKAVGQYHAAWRTGSELRVSDEAVSVKTMWTAMLYRQPPSLGRRAAAAQRRSLTPPKCAVSLTALK